MFHFSYPIVITLPQSHFPLHHFLYPVKDNVMSRIAQK